MKYMYKKLSGHDISLWCEGKHDDADAADDWNAARTLCRGSYQGGQAHMRIEVGQCR